MGKIYGYQVLKAQSHTCVTLHSLELSVSFDLNVNTLVTQFYSAEHQSAYEQLSVVVSVLGLVFLIYLKTLCKQFQVRAFLLDSLIIQ